METVRICINNFRWCFISLPDSFFFCSSIFSLFSSCLSQWGTAREVESGEIAIYILYLCQLSLSSAFFTIPAPFEFLLFWTVQLNIQGARKKKDKKYLWWVKPVIHMLIFESSIKQFLAGVYLWTFKYLFFDESFYNSLPFII